MVSWNWCKAVSIIVAESYVLKENRKKIRQEISNMKK